MAMAAGAKYWKIVKIDNAGVRKIEEISSAKTFFTSAFPEYFAQSEVADDEIQKQLLQWVRNEQTQLKSESNQSQLAQLCLLCYISWHIELVCHQLQSQFGSNHGFSSHDLLPFVLDEDGKLYNTEDSYQSLARTILQSFDPAQGSLVSWIYRKVKQHPDLIAFLLERGVYLVSDWAILNDTRPKQLERILFNFHQLTRLEVEEARQLLESYHAVYRCDRLQQLKARIKKKCQQPTPEQLQQIASRLQQTNQMLSPQGTLKQLQKLASLLREYRIYVRGGCLRTESLEQLDTGEHQSQMNPVLSSPSLENLEQEEETEFLKLYRQQFLDCLNQAVEQVTHSRYQDLKKKKPEKAEQFLVALQLFHCQGKSMTEIAESLGLQAQYQVTRLLKLKPFRADIRHQMLIMLRDRVLNYVRNYTNPQRLLVLDQRIEEALEEQINQLIQDAETESYVSMNRSTSSLFSQVICRYLDARRCKS